MTEELKTCDFYNEKICTLFSKYFGFNVECKNLFLSTIDCDIERECPIKRLEQENKRQFKRIVELKKSEDEFYCEAELANKTAYKYKSALEEIREIVTGNYELLDPQAKKDIENKINEVLNV